MSCRGIWVLDSSGDMVAQKASIEEDIRDRLRGEAQSSFDQNEAKELPLGDDQSLLLFPLKTAAFSGVVTVWDDRSAERRSRLQLESMVHDITNLLAVAQGHLDLLDGVGERTGASLREASWTLERAAELVRGLVRRDQKGPGVTPVQDTLEHLSSIFACSRYVVHCTIDNPVPPVSIAPSDFVEIFQNLLQNACDAMPDGGPVAIKVRSISNHVEISVRDFGVGMAEDISPRIFAPYFSTKVSGRGLGLYRARELVEQYQGRIQVASVQGAGTCFIVTLPSVAGGGV